MDFRNVLEKQVLTLDGAMGTILYSMGIPKGHCYDELSISNPDLIKDIHNGYILAGADIITTNTFGANRNILDTYYDLGHKTRLINTNAAHLANEVVNEYFYKEGKKVFVAGSIGPVTRPMEEENTFEKNELEDLFSEQAHALINGGIDLIILETFSNIDEILLAHKTIRNISSDVPIIPSFTYTLDEVTIFGEEPIDIVYKLQENGCEFAGVNCSVGPQNSLEILNQIGKVFKGSLVIFPNAGRPTFVDGEFIYPSSPDYFKIFAKKAISLGANIIGGCCGTTFEHIESISKACKNLAPKPRTIETNYKAKNQKSTISSEYTKTALHNRLESDKLVISVEIDPPRDSTTVKTIDEVKHLKSCGVDTLNISDLPLARLRMNALSLSKMIIDNIDIDIILHVTARDKNIIAIQSELLGASALGIENILALRGDPPSIGDYPFATGVFDVNSAGLVGTIKNMNSGIDRLGNKFPHRTNFFTGVAVNQSFKMPERELERLNKKQKLGAKFIQTQPVFDSKKFFSFLKKLDSDLPIIASILPLYSAKNANFLNNEVPGITIPEEYIKRIETAENEKEEGIKISIEIFNEIRNEINGICFMPPFGKVSIIESIMNKI